MHRFVRNLHVRNAILAYERDTVPELVIGCRCVCVVASADPQGYRDNRDYGSRNFTVGSSMLENVNFRSDGQTASTRIQSFRCIAHKTLTTMMVGREDGAKDRRRLPRKPDAAGARPVRATTQKKGRSRSTEASGSRARPSPRSQPKPLRPHHKAAVRRPGTAAKAASAANKAKPAASKKPKHLKRKLEQQTLSSSHNGSAPAPVAADHRGGGPANSNHRDKLLQQLQQWQEEKAAYLEKTQLKKRRKISSGTIVKEDLHDGTRASSGRGHVASTKSNGVFPRKNDARVEPALDTHRSTLDSSKPHSVPDRTRSRKVKARREAAPSESSPTIDDDSATPERQRVVAPSTAAAAAAADDEGHDDSGDDHEDDPPSQALLLQKRERGKRRRGRKNNESTTTTVAVAEDVPTQQPEGDESAHAETADRFDQGEKDGTSKSLAIPPSDKSSSTKNKDGRRYCVGRKPVTDFVVGQSYSGTVVYVKPFGIFLDIGCHSDAFCHVSRLADAFVDDPTSDFKPGDAVQAARVVEVDRRGKRITVSLQSEARAADERQSIDARQERLKKRHKKGPALEDPARGHEPVPVPHEPRKQNEAIVIPKVDPPKLKEKQAVALPPAHPVPNQQPDSGLTPQQQLKRARKLERRAARRADNSDSAAP
jgi:predicted RNA-binding protein with RPS1 domain